MFDGPSEVALRFAVSQPCGNGSNHINPINLQPSALTSQSISNSRLHTRGKEHAMQARIWAATIPLHITHPSSPTPYLVQVPRLSYLPLLLPRLTLYFGQCSSFSYQDIPLKNLPVGLLCDLYQPELPWRLTLGHGPMFDIHDTYINSVKEVIRRSTSP